MSRTTKLRRLLTAQFDGLANLKGTEYRKAKRINNGEIRRLPAGVPRNLAKHNQSCADTCEPVVERSVSQTYRRDVRHNTRGKHNGKV